MCIVKEAIYRMLGSEGGGHSLPMFFILVIDSGECFCGHVCVSSLTRFTGGGKDRVYWCVVSFQLIATESSLLCLLCTS